jgi:phytoene synthase
MRAVYVRLLQKLERPKHQIFGPRARLATTHRLAVAAGVWIRSRSS